MNEGQATCKADLGYLPRDPQISPPVIGGRKELGKRRVCLGAWVPPGAFQRYAGAVFPFMPKYAPLSEHRSHRICYRSAWNTLQLREWTVKAGPATCNGGCPSEEFDGLF